MANGVYMWCIKDHKELSTTGYLKPEMRIGAGTPKGPHTSLCTPSFPHSLVNQRDCAKGSILSMVLPHMQLTQLLFHKHHNASVMGIQDQ